MQHHRIFISLSIALGLGLSLSACNSQRTQEPQLPPPQESSPNATISSPPASPPAVAPAPSPTPTPVASTPAPSPTASLQGTYRGGGFTVTVGSDASYRGCNAKNQCLEIPRVFSIQQGIYTWVNGDYTYTLSPAESSGQYRLQVFDPSRTAVVNTLLSSVSATNPTPTPANPEFAQELADNTQCSFIVADSGSVNIRKGPGTQYGVVAQLKRGDGVRAQYREGNWVKIAAKVNGTAPNETFEPIDGWVANQYINGCSEDRFEMWRR